MLKGKLKEHIKRLQRIIEKLEKRNYDLEKKSRILRRFVRDY